MSPRTALAVLGAMAGMLLMRALTGLPVVAAVALGGLGGWLVAALVLGAAADRLERALHRMGGPRRRRSRGRPSDEAEEDA